mmetsp:Transcript_13851/g.21112  ORF Transcript_13851/g.21112 Transcript_13851/m.21112 type:complete len:101 (+) Transcript_13851:815-1117(+)
MYGSIILFGQNDFSGWLFFSIGCCIGYDFRRIKEKTIQVTFCCRMKLKGTWIEYYEGSDKTSTTKYHYGNDYWYRDAWSMRTAIHEFSNGSSEDVFDTRH